MSKQRASGRPSCPGHERGAGGAARRARQHGPGGVPGGRVEVDQAAVGLHDRGLGKVRLAGAADEAAQVAARAAATAPRRSRWWPRARTRGRCRPPRATATRGRRAALWRAPRRARARARGGGRSAAAPPRSPRARSRRHARRARRRRRSPSSRSGPVRAHSLGRAEAQVVGRRAARGAPRTAGRARRGSWRPSAIRSVKPSVAISAVRAPRPSSSALVATVMPWENSRHVGRVAPGLVEHSVDRGDHALGLVLRGGRRLRGDQPRRRTRARRR